MLLADAMGATYVMITTEDIFAVDSKDKVTVDPITNCFNLVGQGVRNDGAEAYAQHYEKFRNLLPSEMKLYGFTSMQTIPQPPL